MKMHFLDLPDDKEWWDSHEWIEFPIESDLLDKVNEMLKPLNLRPEHACYIMLQHLVEHQEEIREKAREGLESEEFLRVVQNVIIAEILDGDVNLADPDTSAQPLDIDGK